MNKFDEMSDFEVNKKLGFKLGAVMRGKTDKYYLRSCPDYCESWSAIGPLIEEHKITLVPRGSIPKLGWLAMKNEHDAASENPKRAAAICMIKLLESK